MTSKIRTSWIPTQTQQWRGQTNRFQLQNLTTIRTFRSSHLEVYSKTEIKTKFLKTNRKRVKTKLKIKSTTAFSNDLGTKFGTVNYRTDICITAIEQKTFYSMAASEVVEIKEINNKKICIWKQPPRADLEKDTLKI